MEQESNDNLDRLFQKAAEKYPLKTNNFNWDIVAAKMEHQKSVLKQQRYKRLQYAALLLLFLSGGFAFFIYNKNSQQKQSTVSALLVKKKESKSLKSSTITGNTPSSKITSTSSPSQASTSSIVPSSVSNKLSNRKGTFQNTNRLDVNQVRNNDIVIAPVLSNNQLYNIQKNSKVILPGDQANIPANMINTKSETLLQQQSEQNKDAKAQKKSATIKLHTASKSFYGSIFISPDFSTVKFEELSAPGLKVGLQLGYRINNQLSAEVNLVRYNSRFYSSGKDFSRSNIKINPTTIIDDVNGKSKFTEIPLDLRYNFSKTNNHLFATAGTSVALVTHTERYNYDVTKNGTPANISRHFSSQTKTKFFSSINLSAGYESPVFNKLKIKFEPYYQLPIKKFGIGDLPVTHFGVNIGIVKDLK